MQQTTAKDKSLSLAIRLVKLYQQLKRKEKRLPLTTELLMAGTRTALAVRVSVAALTEEEFMANLGRALHHATETAYWLDLLFRTGNLKEKLYLSLTAQCHELIQLLTNSIQTSRQVLA